MASKTHFYCDFCEKEVTDDDHFNSIRVVIETEYKVDSRKDAKVNKYMLLCDECFKPAELAIFAATHDAFPRGAPLTRTDKYGNRWPDAPDSEFCSTCGQPDNCGDCNHERLSAEEVRDLGGVPS